MNTCIFATAQNYSNENPYIHEGNVGSELWIIDVFHHVCEDWDSWYKRQWTPVMGRYEVSFSVMGRGHPRERPAWPFTSIGLLGLSWWMLISFTYSLWVSLSLCVRVLANVWSVDLGAPLILIFESKGKPRAWGFEYWRLCAQVKDYWEEQEVLATEQASIILHAIPIKNPKGCSLPI